MGDPAMVRMSGGTIRDRPLGVLAYQIADVTLDGVRLERNEVAVEAVFSSVLTPRSQFCDNTHDVLVALPEHSEVDRIATDCASIPEPERPPLACRSAPPEAIFRTLDQEVQEFLNL